MAASNYDKLHQGEGDFDFCELDETPVKLEANAELDNFLGRVDEITKVIQSLASKDASENERGMRQANLLLHEKKEPVGDGESLSCETKHNRTLINKVKDDPSTSTMGQDEMNAQAFMKVMEKDSDERTARRKERKVISDKFRKTGNIKFAQKDFAGALKNYNEAIQLIKDSPCLYNNRALTYIRLGIFSSALEDCEKAIFLEEHSLRARMFLAKAYFLMGNADKCREALEEARIKLPGSVELINDYQRDLFNMSTAKPFDFDLDTEKKWQAAARYEGTKFPVQLPKENKLDKKMSSSKLNDPLHNDGVGVAEVDKMAEEEIGSQKRMESGDGDGESILDTAVTT